MDHPNIRDRRHLLVTAAAALGAGVLPDLSGGSAAAADDGAVQTIVGSVLTHFGQLVNRKDLAIVEAFATDALLVGSSTGEIAQGRTAIREFLGRAYAKPHVLAWEWAEPRAWRVGDLIWFFVESTVVVTEAQHTDRMPYRVAGVLELQQGRWLWRQYHGSEPSAA